jgi:hypothetical protein
MDYDKSIVDYLEKKFNFTLDGLEKFWNIYKVTKAESWMLTIDIEISNCWNEFRGA